MKEQYLDAIIIKADNLSSVEQLVIAGCHS